MNLALRILDQRCDNRDHAVATLTHYPPRLEFSALELTTLPLKMFEHVWI